MAPAKPTGATNTKAGTTMDFSQLLIILPWLSIIIKAGLSPRKGHTEGAGTQPYWLGFSLLKGNPFFCYPGPAIVAFEK
jgi:hypothetical protein